MRPGHPLRVTVVGLNYAPEHTGIAPYTTGMAQHLAEAGMQVTAITGHPHYPGWRLHDGFEEDMPPGLQDGVHVHRVRHPIPPRAAGLPRVLMEAVFALRAGLQLFRRRTDAVVVVSPGLLSVVPALLSGRLRRHRVGVVVQDLYGAALAETGLGGGAVTRLTARTERALLRGADEIVVIHEVFRRRLLADGIPAERIRVIPNWSHVDVPARINRDAVRASLGWRADEVIALHAGNMGVKQGLDGLVDVGRQAEAAGSKVRVVLMGDGSQRDALVAAAAGASQVSFVDPLPAGTFEAALCAADVLVLHEKPGVVEMSVPSKLTTYFAAGRPVVAATDDRSGAAALIRASRAGVVTVSGDAQGVLDAVESIASDPAVAAEMGVRGRGYAIAELSGRESLTAYELWVRDLASKPATGKSRQLA